jgi:hypothetical protein
MNLSDRDIAVEPQLDLDVDSPEVLRWIPHSEDRCSFAELIAANFS